MKKTILITGGTGYLGKNLGLKLKKKFNVILAGRNNKQNFVAKKETGCETAPLDVASIDSIRDIVNAYKPNIIIHAAATKFVDLSEKFPFECVDCNILGSTNIARVAIDKGIQTVIGISTDKASPPVKNIYGLSKTLMEKLFISANSQSKTNFMCVRYGNVVWSTGSVLTIWRTMHKQKENILTTGPNMRRYFFTVDEAANLVMTGLKNISKFKGKILSREMKAAKMIDILKVWVKYYGGKYKIADERDGDRIDEYLIGESEKEFTTKISIDKINHYLIDFNKKVKKPLKDIVSSATAEKLSEKDIKKLLDYGF